MKTAVITGGNSGMGKAAALVLAKKGYRVIIHGRDEQKTKEAADDIRIKSGNISVEYIIADVSVISGMKALADAVKQKTDIIHALVLSTGVILPNYILTKDDLEKGFVVQYLSRFAMVQLLLPELKKGRAKIAHAAAPVLSQARIFFEDLALKNNFTMYRAMAQEMFANHLFVQEFARRYPDQEMLMNLMNVGIADTGITRNMNFFIRLMIRIIGNSTEKASENLVFLVDNDSVNFSGYFLKKPGNSNVKEVLHYDNELAEKLWDRSMELIKGIL